MTSSLRKPLLVLAALSFLASACASESTTAVEGDQPAGVVVQPSDTTVDVVPAETGGESDLDPVPVVDFLWFDGTPGSTADLIGTPTVVNFWASNCPPCVAEMPAFEEVHQALASEVDFVGMNVADEATSARELADLTGVTYQLAEDPDSAVFRSFGGFVLPTTVLLNAQGDIAYVWVGALSGEELSTLIDEHILPGSQ